jgi:hypothetical protein
MKRYLNLPEEVGLAIKSIGHSSLGCMPLPYIVLSKRVQVVSLNVIFLAFTKLHFLYPFTFDEHIT